MAACDEYQGKKSVCAACSRPQSEHKPPERIHAGYLEKTGDGDSKYQKRWFVLDKIFLKYFANDTEKQLKGDIRLSTILAAEQVPASANIMVSVSGRVYNIRAPSSAEASYWTRLINEQLASIPRANTIGAASRAGTVSQPRTATMSSTATASPSPAAAAAAVSGGGNDYEDDFEDDFEEPEPSESETDKEKDGIEESNDDNDHDRTLVPRTHSDSEEESERREKSSRASSASARDFRPRLNNDMLEALRATQEENSRALQPIARPGTANTVEIGPTSVLDFAGARRRQKAAVASSKASRRWADLSKVVTLDTVSVSLLELAPQDGYSLFMRGLGRGASRHAAVQSTEDRVERDQQTETIETATAWTQQPPTDLAGTGSTATKADDTTTATNAPSSRHLVDFVRTAGAVCLRLLEESVPPTRARKNASALSSSLSADCVRPATGLAFLAGRPVCALDHSPASSGTIVTAYTTPQTFRNAGGSDKTRQFGFLCVWNTSKPTAPSKILVMPSLADPTSCCFGPPKGAFVFAADTDGVLSVWDLREAAELHLTRDFGVGGPLVLRYPSYSTASLGESINHVAPIVFLRPFAVSRGTRGADGGDSVQIASLDQDGTLRTWLVAELPAGEMAGNDDPGLLPGARVRLVPASTHSLFSPTPSVSRTVSTLAPANSLLQASAFAFFPDRPNHCLVGTTTGTVLRRVRFGQQQSPREFAPLGGPRSPCHALAFAPFSPTHFLAGYGDGSIALFSVDFEHPLVMWSDACSGARVTWLSWSLTRPCLFFALDSQSRIYAWDLGLSPGSAMLTEQPALRRSSVSDPAEKLPALLVSAVSISTATPPELAIAFGTGLIEAHRLPALLAGPRAGELEELRAFLARSPCAC
eukprot:m.119408 g.119408  ORF g.119408 m.119408 type:complete len:877 (+) comp14526_c6_seq2:109-2739(+)